MAMRGVVDAVMARIGSNWNGIAVRDPGKAGQVPQDASEFIQVQFPVAIGSQLTVGAPGENIYREEGAIRFLLNLRRTEGGLSAALGRADDLGALFRGKDFGGVQTFAPSSAVLNDDNDKGGYFVLSFAVPYQFDIVG